MFSRGVLHLVESQALICESGVCDREDLLLLPKLAVAGVDAGFHLRLFSSVLLLLPLCSTVLEPDLHLLL